MSDHRLPERPERILYPQDLPSAGPALDRSGLIPNAIVETDPDPDHTLFNRDTDRRVPDNTPLAELTTMRVGGAAERIAVARSSHELVRLASELWESDEPWLLIGGGSNTVVCDEGYPGTVVLVRYDGVEVIDSPDTPQGYVRLRVQAGHDWDELVEWTVEHGYAGIEMLSGIPGLVGAAPVQNIGAYGGDLAKVLHSVTVYDRETGQVGPEAAADLALGYRDSVWKHGREAVVLSVDLVLRAAGDGLSEPIVFPQLAKALDVKLGARVPLKQVRETVLQLRASKGMVLDHNDKDTWSAGSFFINPVVSAEFARGLPAEAPRFEVSDSQQPGAAVTLIEELQRGEELRIGGSDAVNRPMVKLSAAWLIENAGISKGFRLPGSGASISTKHSLAITNRGGASADDVAQLARLVIAMVQTEFGVVLVPEPNLYGLEL